jgi:hypothetical protein
MRPLRASGLAQSRREGRMVMHTFTEAGAGLLAATLAPVELPA